MVNNIPEPKADIKNKVLNFLICIISFLFHIIKSASAFTLKSGLNINSIGWVYKFSLSRTVVTVFTVVLNISGIRLVQHEASGKFLSSCQPAWLCAITETSSL